MIKIAAVIFATCIFICVPGIFFTLPGATIKSKSEMILFESFTLETLTVYNPIQKQCDADPLVTASKKKIDLNKLEKGSLRWMALSRNMLKRWGGQLNYGDTVLLQAGDLTIDGKWVIQDTMNRRFTNKGDLLFDSSRKSGMWRNVKVLRYKKYQVAAHL
jgi:hypothetical protein